MRRDSYVIESRSHSPLLSETLCLSLLSPHLFFLFSVLLSLSLQFSFLFSVSTPHSHLSWSLSSSTTESQTSMHSNWAFFNTWQGNWRERGPVTTEIPRAEIECELLLCLAFYFNLSIKGKCQNKIDVNYTTQLWVVCASVRVPVV